MRVICFAPHPDDETIGVGGRLPGWRDVFIVHSTDGAPRNMEDAFLHGFTTRQDYARARRKEVLDALALAGISAQQTSELGFADQESCRNLFELTKRVGGVIESLQPDTILAPAYEGGHPDHDSLAFAVQCACRMIGRLSSHSPAVMEYALYHSGGGEFRAGEFLPHASADVAQICLNPQQAALKRRMLDCFLSQRQVLAPFRTMMEFSRRAPEYDFTQPPHAGRLHYENFNWGITGAEWRRLAAEAAHQLGVDGP